ncbi:MAG: hypothetical protein J6K43_14410 [Lachnospiraceae bacterium]|nr:hypothetical protein [Lachnospiraceae bacterium]
MNYSNVGNVLSYAYQSANRTQKTIVNSTSFTECLQGAEKTGIERVDAYTKYLSDKYGVIVSVQSVGKDQKSLDRVGGSMSGRDVIIAPNVLEEMTNDSRKATYYEQKIEYFFHDVIPRETALCASKGLVFEPGGVVIHEDGTVTYICGCSDSPERVAEVNAINKAKREKEAAQRKASLERSQTVAEERRQIVERHYQKQMMAEALQNQVSNTRNLYIVNQSQVMLPVVAAYKMQSAHSATV